MPTYRYQGLSEAGRTIRGKMQAANELDLEERLRSIGLDLIHHKRVRESKGGLFESISTQDLIVLCIHLEQLDRAGVPILDSIADLRDTAETNLMKTIMSEIHESIKSGELLSASLSNHPKVFSPIFVSLVAAGEKTGNLADIFNHLAHHLKWNNNIRRRIKKAIYYPAFLLTLMAGIMALMMLFVIPKLSKFLVAQNFELPMYTTALIATSDFFVAYWYLIFTVPVVVIMLIKLLTKFSNNARYMIDRIKLMIPFAGKTIKKVELARFCHFFSVMYRSGIGILECLDSAGNIVQNRVVREQVTLIRNGVADGASLTGSIQTSSQFPSLVIRMFKVGEESGNLDATLDNINFFYDREVDDGVNAMVGVIQPLLTLIMGGLMMWISLAVFGPLYNSFSNMNF